MVGQRHAPDSLPQGKMLYLLYRRLDGPQGCLDGSGKYRFYRDSIPVPSREIQLLRCRQSFLGLRYRHRDSNCTLKKKYTPFALQYRRFMCLGTIKITVPHVRSDYVSGYVLQGEFCVSWIWVYIWSNMWRWSWRRTDHEDPEGEYMYSSTLSLTLVIDVGGWLMSLSCHFTPPSPRNDPVPIVQEARWATGPFLRGTQTGIRSLYRPSRSQSLYRLS
jgi:hypothetical protein